MNKILMRIEDLRLRSGLTKAALAKKIGIVPLTVTNWHKMDTIPSLFVIEKICQATNITFEEFFSDTELLSSNDWQDKLLYNWRMLNNEEKCAVNNILDLLLSKRGNLK